MSWWVRDLSVRFGTRLALDGVSLEAERGRLQAVIGGDGAGKSTLLRVLAGIHLDQTGSVQLPPQERIAYVPSQGGVFGDLTVAENIEFVADAYGLRDWRNWSQDLLERAGVGRFVDRLARQLSGGQRRKLAGCMALLPRPDLLVLDEATTGVDPVSRMELWRLVSSAASDGAAVVASTSYLDEAERMEAVLLLHEGRTLASGVPADLIDGIPGAVFDLQRPTDRIRAWRSGRRWRQWAPEPPPGAEPARPHLGDAAIVLELAQSDQTRSESPPSSHQPASDGPPIRSRAHPLGDLVGSAVTARRVTRRFGDFTAVDGLDIDLTAGEIVGLLGANGAGKTTLIKMVLGLLAPTAGEIRLFGERHSRRQRSRIGYVPQNLGLYGDLSAAENLAFRASVFGAEPTAESARGASESASKELVGLLPLGLQRQVALEAAIQHRPELLVLDEPTSGVSPLARSRLWDLIHDQSDRGVAVLVSTHYMDEAEQADRLVVMSGGRTVASGSTSDIVRGRTAVEVSTEEWSDAFHALDRPGRQLRLAGRAIRVLGEPVDAITADLARVGIDAAVEPVPATLEEVFIELDAIQPEGDAATRPV